MAVGEAGYGLVDLRKRGRFEVGDADGELGAPVGEQAHGFDAFQTAAVGADIAGDGTDHGDVCGVEVDVVGNEELARAYGTGSCGGMQAGAAEVGAAGSLLADGVPQA